MHLGQQAVTTDLTIVAPSDNPGDEAAAAEEKKKLQVMVKIFGRKTPLELSFMQVEKE